MKNMLSERVGRIDASGIRKVFALGAKLEDPVNFSIGQPDFDVPEVVKEAAIRAIRDGENRYSQTAGDEELKAKIAEQVKGDFGWESPSVLISSGVSGGLLLAFMALIDPGDEVIIPDPYFVIYKHLVNMLGGRCVFVDSYPEFRLPVEKIAAAITNRTKMIICNSPANPTGVVYTASELEALARAAAEKDVLVMSDQIYEKFCYDGPCPSIAKYYDKTLLMRGFSKSYGMPGWRLGYVAAGEPLRAVIEEMTKVQQYTFVCAPTPLQKAAITAMDCDVSEAVDAYGKKRGLIYDGLRDKFHLVRPEGAFYAFITAPGGRATEFAEKAMEKNVLIIPGNVFSERDTHFRISYATSDERIRQGVEILRGLA
ncbi:MAG: aminotransferase class I/II-fold pyridoxal phosphate-dependent enzyme [Sedimentisphaerales bacterium]|nr:aminotransferase class I/II-fold pyridoxal phosphate-dependent enzyme [Sedimentisphaerales bacterium]